MKRIARIPVLAAATVSLLVVMTGCRKLEARDQLNKGVQAYKATKYEQAIDHFQKAVALDPTYPMTRIYLATAYAQQVVPDLKTPENIKTANLAIDSFNDVLKKNPNDINSLKGIAGIYFEIDKYDEAKQEQKKVLEVDPKDAEAAYTVGVIDWRLAYSNAVKALASVGMQDKGDGNPKMPKKVCATLVQENGPLVQEGLDYLQKAVSLRPNYDDAMSYINLLYRRKADLECGNDAARKADVAQAEQWNDKAMGARKANEEKKSKGPGGIVLDQNGNAK